MSFSWSKLCGPILKVTNLLPVCVETLPPSYFTWQLFTMRQAFLWALKAVNSFNPVTHYRQCPLTGALFEGENNYKVNGIGSKTVTVKETKKPRRTVQPLFQMASWMARVPAPMLQVAWAPMVLLTSSPHPGLLPCLRRLFLGSFLSSTVLLQPQHCQSFFSGSTKGEGETLEPSRSSLAAFGTKIAGKLNCLASCRKSFSP